MKFIPVLILFMSTSAFAMNAPLCPGNKKLVKVTVQKWAEAKFGKPCQISKVKKNMDWESEGLEGYQAEASCPKTVLRTYNVTVQKNHNVCYVKKVKLSELMGSQCGLTDTFGGESDEWQFDESAEIDLQILKPDEIRALPDITQRQILANFAGEIADVVDAVKELVAGSEANEAYIRYFTFKGQRYMTIESYPDGNSYGPIFKADSDRVHATNGDGSISCVE